MRVIFNQLPARGLQTGVGHYTSQLLGAMRRLSPGQVDPFPADWILRAGAEYRHLAEYWRQLRTRWRKRPAGLAGLLSRLLGRPAAALAGTAARCYRDRIFFGNAYDLYHEPNFVPCPSSLPTITTIHDLSPVLHPEWHPVKRVNWVEQNLEHTLAQSRRIVTVSEFTRQAVIRVLGVAPDHVTTILNGVRPGLRPLPPEVVTAGLRRLALPPRYLLYLGTIEPRKNILQLMRIYGSLPESLRTRWPLVLVGSWGWNFEREWDYYHAEARQRGVIHVGYVANDDLPIIYNGARALIYPSLYEGFGLPPVEMLACGGAVLASDAGAHIESVGSQAHLIHPDDADGWRRAITRVLTDEPWWHTLRCGAVETAGRFNWERCAQETLQVYRAVAGRAVLAPVPCIPVHSPSRAA